MYNLTTIQSSTLETTKKVRGKPFVKGDPRINRKGRPKTFDAVRSLAQKIAEEPDPESGRTIVEKILRQWATSNDPNLQIRFIEVAYGRIPQENPSIGISVFNLDAALSLLRSQNGEQLPTFSSS